MTTIFDGYDEEYRALTSDISKKLSEIASYEDQKDKKKTSIVHVGDLLTQATQLVRTASISESVGLVSIQQMELEVRSLDAATRRELSKKVDQYKKSLASLSADHKRIREKEEREGLFAARKEVADTEEVGTYCCFEYVERLILTVTVFYPCFSRSLAIGIAEELGRNREKIEATHSKVKGVNEMARRGGNIVGRMSARDKRQRLALSIAAGFIIIAILLLIYFGIFKKK
ncbi:hypothetical protein BBJ28_00011258 [Nothophytophthora sp. Chile5]|nr:hypothetical protein BBJ28_00011258 [Nothophytophthora sp. Chile5]